MYLNFYTIFFQNNFGRVLPIEYFVRLMRLKENVGIEYMA